MRQIILASGSPRRKELLGAMGVQFAAVPSQYDEKLDSDRPVRDVAIELGLGKALDVAVRYPEAIVIGSDTIVSVDGKQLGKPNDRQHAYDMLRGLAGRVNDITTSLAVVCKADNIEITDAVLCQILLKPFDEAAIQAYLDTGDYADKAGGYGVQSGFGPLVTWADDEYDAIMGLPTHRLAEILQGLGIAAHPAKVDNPLPHRPAA